MKYLLPLFFIAGFSVSLTGAEMAVYTGEGTWDDGITAFVQFLEWKEITYEYISSEEVNTYPLKEYYEAIYFPGGDADYYDSDINLNGIQHIQELVSEGGGYIGMCAGAEFACDKFIWEGFVCDYSLDLFDGTAVGPIDAIAPWPDYAMTSLTMNSGNPINQYEPDTEVILYWGGSAFYPHSGAVIDTVSSYDEFNSRNAIINLNYGSGRVLLIGPHPEIEEDDDRDSTDVAQEQDDFGSDWPFLWSSVDWLLGRPITSPNTSVTSSSNSGMQFSVSPNPFSSTTVIHFDLTCPGSVSIQLFDLSGRMIDQFFYGVLQAGDQAVNLDASSWTAGKYLIHLSTGNSTITQRCVLIR